MTLRKARLHILSARYDSDGLLEVLQEITAFDTRSLHQGFAGGGGKPIDALSIT